MEGGRGAVGQRESSELVWVATVGVRGAQCVGAVVVRWERDVVGRGGQGTWTWVRGGG